MFGWRKVLLYLGVIAVSWILVLSIPSTRTMFLAQSFRGGSEILPSAVPNKEPNFIQLARKHPENLALRLAKIRQQIRYQRYLQFDMRTNIPDVPVPDEKGISKEFEQLAKDFPDSPLAVYASLAHLMTGMSPIRVGGRLGDPKAFEHEKKGIPSPERRGERDYTPEQWRQVIALCKKGQKVDPQNGIFDVLEAYWQFAEFHDNEGWKAFKRAVQKPEISSYLLPLGEQGILAYKSGYHRNLMWEEIAENSYSFSLSFEGSSFAAEMRQLTRWLVWEGMKQQTRGDHARALKMYDLTFQLADKLNHSAIGLMDKLTAIALESLATSGPYYAGVRADVPHKTEFAALRQVRQKSAAFKKYASEHGRNDIAAYGDKCFNDFAAEMAMAENDTIDTLQKPFLIPAFAGFLLWRIDVLLLWLLAGAAIIGIFAALASKVLLRNEKRMAYNETDFWRGAVSFAALPASLILLVGYAVSFYRECSQGKYDSYIGMVTIDFLANSQIAPSWMAFIGVMTPIIFGIAYCWHRAAKDHQHSGAPKVLLWKRILGVIGSLLFVISWAAMAQWTNIVYFAAIFVALGTFVFLCNRIVQMKRIDNIKSTFADFVHLLTQSSLRFVALASVLYLLTLAIAIPIRAPLHEREMTKAAQGEMVFYKDALTDR